VLGLQTSQDTMGYLSIIDIVFPLLGVLAVWRFNEDEKEQPPCIVSASIMLVYILWCLCWVVLGTVLVLGRAHVYTPPDTPAGEAFFGNASSSGYGELSTLIINSVEIGVQAIGFLVGIIVRIQMVSEGKSFNPGCL